MKLNLDGIWGFDHNIHCIGNILDERMSCEVFESMDTITLRAQADIAAIWNTTIDDSSCKVVESKFPNCETMSLLTLTEIASIWLCIL